MDLVSEDIPKFSLGGNLRQLVWWSNLWELGGYDSGGVVLLLMNWSRSLLIPIQFRIIGLIILIISGLTSACAW